MIIPCWQQRDSTIHIHVSIFPKTPLSSRLPHNIEQSSLCYTVGPCWLPILNIPVHSQLPTIPFPHPSPWQSKLGQLKGLCGSVLTLRNSAGLVSSVVKPPAHPRVREASSELTPLWSVYSPKSLLQFGHIYQRRKVDDLTILH